MQKDYTGSKKITLPPADLGAVTLGEALKKRRSIRQYTTKPLQLSELSALLFSASGMTEKRGDVAFRTAPSAGALYPIEVYLVVNNVAELERGIYYYCSADQTLAFIKEGDFRKHLAKACLNQEMSGEAAVAFVLAAVFDRSCWKYGERGYRYASLECGHISQNIYLAATALGLGSVAIGAFYDDDMNRLLSVDGTAEAVLYVHAVGKM